MKTLHVWQYAWPRLLLLVVVYLLVQFVVSWFIERSMVHSAEASLGAIIEVGKSRVSLLGCQAVFRDFRVAHPHAPMRNLLEADYCELCFDAEALLHKQAVVRHGRVLGLQFGTPRAKPAELPDAKPDDASSDWLHSKSGQLAQHWLERLEDQFQQDLGDQLESVRLTNQLLARWPERYAALEDRVREFHQRTSEFQSQVRLAQANPLRHARFLESLPDRIELLRVEYEELIGEVEALPDLAETERREIVAARRHDEQLLREKLHFDRIDDGVLTAYLLQEQWASPVGDLVTWLRWMRQIMPAEPRTSPAVRRRGQNVFFAGCDPLPRLWIRSLDLQGTTQFGGQTLHLTGTLTNFATGYYYQPMKFVLQSDGPMPLELRGTVDRTGAVARDEFSLECRGLTVPKLVLGVTEKLQLSLESTTASLRVRLVLEGDQLSGDMELVQAEPQITTHVGGDLNRPAIADTLQDSLAAINSVSTRVSLSGTLDEPQWSLSSSLGPTLAEATREAFDQAVAHYAAQVAARSQQKVDERLARLDRQISRQQHDLLPQLAAAADLWEEIKTADDSEKRLSYEQLGRERPAGSLFR